METYDGTTSLQKVLEKLHGGKLSNNAMSAITRKYRKRLNVPSGQIRQPSDKLKIYQWECDAKSATGNAEPVLQSADTIQTTIVEPVLQKSTPQAVGNVEPVLQSKRKYADQYEYKTIAFSTTNGTATTRHVIKLESYLVDAIVKNVGAKNVPQFLKEQVSLEWNEATGDKSIVKMVKRSIFLALIAKIPK